MRKHWPDTDGGHGRWALGQAHLHRQGPGGTKEHASLREVQTVWRCSSRELGEQWKMGLGGGRQGLGHPKFANYAERLENEKYRQICLSLKNSLRRQ